MEGRDLATGIEGSGPVGGAMDGRDGRGRVVVDMMPRGGRMAKYDGTEKRRT